MSKVRPIIIDGLDTGYKITDDGVVYGIRGKPLKHTIQKDGYHRIYISRRYRSDVWRCVSHLMAEAFIPNPKNYPFVTMLDGDRDNLCVENLMWVKSRHNSSGYQNLVRDNIHRVCDMISKGARVKTISGLTGVSSEIIKAVYGRKIFKNVSEPYQFPDSLKD